MLTNEEFRIKQQEKYDKAMGKKLKPLCELNFSKPRLEKQLLLDAIEKDRTGVIVPVDTCEKFYRSNYKTINAGGNVAIRCRKMKEHYCINDVTLDELKQMELEQMLEHYSAYMKSSRKGFMLFIRNYVIVDESLLYEMISITSSTPQQAYKKRIMWKRHKEEHFMFNDIKLFQELERLTPAQKKHFKEMHEYNNKTYKKHS